MGPLGNSDGSAEWTCGQAPHACKLICSVNGPLEAKVRDELPQQATLELVYRKNVGVPMIRERLIQDKLHTCLLAVLRRDLLPRTLVQVVVQLLEGDTALEVEVSEGINVMCLALMNAGVPMSGIIAAVSYGITAEDKVVPLVSRTRAASEELESRHAMAFKFVDGESPKLVVCESIGQFTKKQLFALLEQAQKDAAKVGDELRQRERVIQK